MKSRIILLALSIALVVAGTIYLQIKRNRPHVFVKPDLSFWQPEEVDMCSKSVGNGKSCEVRGSDFRTLYRITVQDK